MSTAKQSYDFSGLFEAELLLELMLRFWQHPLAEDVSFRNWLLDGTSEALRQSLEGTTLLEDIKPEDMNFIAAMWYVEWCALNTATTDAISLQRQQWLETVRRTLPSCFCDPSDLLD